jgi:hypothetical protein
MFSPSSQFVRSAKSCTDTTFTKEHFNREQFETECRLLRLACAAGCSPEFTTDGMKITLPRLTPLADRLPLMTPSEKEATATEVLTCVRRLHRAGVCHRDLKVGDILFGGDGEILFVDFELGAEVDPKGPCYDLLGPASGVPVPFVHPQMGSPVGIWWDAPNPWGLWNQFGHVAVVHSPGA